MPFSTVFTALSSPYVAHERTAQNLILSVRSLRFALCLKERHRSQNEGSLKSEERLSDFKERCAQLWEQGSTFNPSYGTAPCSIAGNCTAPLLNPVGSTASGSTYQVADWPSAPPPASPVLAPRVALSTQAAAQPPRSLTSSSTARTSTSSPVNRGLQALAT